MGISVKLDRPQYRAGEEIIATIMLNLEKPINARGLYATLSCIQKENKKIVRHMPQAEIEEKKKLGLYTEVPFTYEERVVENIIYRKERKLDAAKEYQKEEYTVKFKLPSDALSTSQVFGHDNKINNWSLHVKLDVPFALDINCNIEVCVGM